MADKENYGITVATLVLRLTEGCFKAFLREWGLDPYNYGIHRRFGLVYYIDLWRMHTTGRTHHDASAGYMGISSGLKLER